MSATEYTTASARKTATPRKSWASIAGLVGSAIRRWQRNRVISELSRLDNRQLEDIGISRGDIPKVADRLFREKEDFDRTLSSGTSVDRRAPAEMRKVA